jgi:SsrA-binding protein
MSKAKQKSSAKPATPAAEPIHTVATNRKARFQYEIMDKLEAGLALIGSEVKSLREAKASLEEAYASVDRGEVWLHDCEIPEYVKANQLNHKPKRARKLLLHRREIDKLLNKASQKGLTIIPLRIYFKRGIAKVEIAIARGRKLHDKRDALKSAEAKRDIERARGARRKGEY